MKINLSFLYVLAVVFLVSETLESLVDEEAGKAWKICEENNIK